MNEAHIDLEDSYEEDYHYQDWGVDRVDLDFKSGIPVSKFWKDFSCR